MVLQTSRSILRATFPASATKTYLDDVWSGIRHKILVCRVIGSPFDLSSVLFRALRASVCKDWLPEKSCQISWNITWKLEGRSIDVL